jgi:hypothetical protein
MLTAPRSSTAVTWIPQVSATVGQTVTATSLTVAAGEGEQLADLPFVEFVPHGGQTLGQRPGVDEPVGRRS